MEGVRAPRCTIVQIPDSHVPAEGPLHDEVDAIERVAAAIRGTDARLILSGHTHRVRAGTLAGIPVWVSPAMASNADVFAQGGFAATRAAASRASTCSTMARS
jgi:Icc protein